MEYSSAVKHHPSLHPTFTSEIVPGVRPVVRTGVSRTSEWKEGSAKNVCSSREDRTSTLGRAAAGQLESTSDHGGQPREVVDCEAFDSVQYERPKAARWCGHYQESRIVLEIGGGAYSMTRQGRHEKKAGQKVTVSPRARQSALHLNTVE